MPALLREHINPARLGQDGSDSQLDGSLVGDIELDDSKAEGPQGIGVRAVSAGNVAH